MKERAQLAREIARAAARGLATRFERGVKIDTKSSAIDLVTEADRAAEAEIVAAIVAAFPGDAILGEESGTRAGDPGAPRWIVDPLDGTTNFAHGMPHFSVSIAVEHGGVMQVGVVHDVLRDETFFATRGGGMWLQRGDAEPKRRHVTPTADMAAALVATGFPYDIQIGGRDNLLELGRVIRRVRGIRRAGSAALDLAYVAAGRFDAYWEYALAPWDCAAGVLLVTEAGGELAQIDGSPWILGAESIVVANPNLLPAFRAALAGA
jgi:myo-inositol-1(or 4)-monophosphatase